MGQYRYSDAAKAFEKVLAAAPDWTAARYNLGLAFFNMHGVRGGQAHLETARETFEAVLAKSPDHLHGRFVLGLYHQHLGNTEEALECFEKVYQGDPHDTHATYKYAEALLALRRNEEGVAMLEKVIAADPGFISAVYRLAGLYIRSGRREEALRLFARFEGLRKAELTGGLFGVQKVYGTVGKYYRALGADNLPLPPHEEVAARRILFSPKVQRLKVRTPSWKWNGGSVELPGIAAGDVDGDGDLDLCLAGDGRGNTSLWLNDGSGCFGNGTAIAPRTVSPSFGDVDNDGDLDLWLGGAGENLLMLNNGKGKFKQQAFTADNQREAITSCARLADVDSDGDLDLLAFRLKRGSVPASDGEAAPAPTASRIWNNNRDGTFDDLAERLGLSLPEVPVASVVYDDFDGDRDLDMVVFPAGDVSPIAWVNDRVWEHHTLDAATSGLSVRGVFSATSGDPDKDGDRDLLVFAEDGLRLFVNDGRFGFEAHQGFSDRCGRLGGTGGQFADLDNDGDLDVVIADARRDDGTCGPALLINDWPADRYLNAAELDPGCLLGAVKTQGHASCMAADFNGDGACDLFWVPTDAEPMLLANVTPGGHWIGLDFRGTRRGDKKSRSNNSAIGARVEIKSGRMFQQYVVGAPSGAVAMPPLRVHAGLGDRPTVEWLRIIWPDGVLQAELELAADRVTEITEIPRKTSSCPNLFAWDGSQYAFVSDFGGVGGLGYLVAAGSYAPPDPTEYVRIAQLRPRDEHYVLQVSAPLEEVIYFDEAKLIAIDHPDGTEVYPNEMMAVGIDPPKFEVFCYRRPIDPVRAVDHRGNDVTETLLHVDRHYAGAGDGQSLHEGQSFAGIVDEHCVELDFGGRLANVAAADRLILFLHGWVEYGYSSTNFAAEQAGCRAEAPSIAVLRDGRWVALFEEVGYPAGLQHMMTLDVSGKILPSDRRVRIRSNMELYWDRIFLAVHAADASLSMEEVAAAGADLHFRGFPREYSPDGRHPNLYDYQNVDRSAGWKLMAGDYTRFGEVGPLVDAADDCYVIMGRGEELTLRFPAAAFRPVPKGQRRTFLLKTDSFCKDMDLYTAHGDTVEPLPFHAMSGYPYSNGEVYPDNEKTREYRRRYNTRRVQTR